MANAAHSSKGAHILIVDDDAPVRTLLAESLEHSGYTVQEAENGQVALDLVRQQTFDLALVDLSLGDIYGLDVVNILRRAHPEIAVLILTGFSSLESALQALHLGVDEYLVKPVDVARLREQVRQVLESHQRGPSPGLKLRESAHASGYAPAPASQEPLTIGCLVVDLTHNEASCQGKLLEITGIELRILKHLAQQAPRPTSAEELLYACAGYRAAPQQAEEMIQQHIHRIQQQLEGSGCQGCALLKMSDGYLLKAL
jgi:DNA-binding response OmpR family regulator